MAFDPNKVKRYDAGELLDGTSVIWAEDFDKFLSLYDRKTTVCVASRKIVQVVPIKGGIGLWALCDDGTLWCGEFTGAITKTEVGMRRSLNWRYISTRAIFDKDQWTNDCNARGGCGRSGRRTGCLW